LCIPPPELITIDLLFIGSTKSVRENIFQKHRHHLPDCELSRQHIPALYVTRSIFLDDNPLDFIDFISCIFLNDNP
jgi:hypothetical protein